MIAVALAGCGRDPMFPDLPPGPRIAVTAPTTGDTYATYFRNLRISGTVSGAEVVRWTNTGNATSGLATLEGDTWSVELRLLTIGPNPVTLYADKDGRARSVGTAHLLLTYDPRLDPEPPVIIITFPTTSETYSWADNTIVLAGRASDNSGLFDVTWANETTGQHGYALGQEEWQASVPLTVGMNQIRIKAIDWGGKFGSDSIYVTRGSGNPGGPRAEGARVGSPEPSRSGIVSGRPREPSPRAAEPEPGPKAFGWRLSGIRLPS